MISIIIQITTANTSFLVARVWCLRFRPSGTWILQLVKTIDLDFADPSWVCIKNIVQGSPAPPTAPFASTNQASIRPVWKIFTSHQNAPPRDHLLSQIYWRNQSGPLYTILSNENGPARLIRHQRLFGYLGRTFEIAMADGGYERIFKISLSSYPGIVRAPGPSTIAPLCQETAC